MKLKVPFFLTAVAVMSLMLGGCETTRSVTNYIKDPEILSGAGKLIRCGLDLATGDDTPCEELTGRSPSPRRF